MRIYKNGGVSQSPVKIRQYNDRADVVMAEFRRFYNGTDLATLTARVAIKNIAFAVAGVADYVSKIVTDNTVKISIIIPSFLTSTVATHDCQVSFVKNGMAEYEEHFKIEIAPSIMPESWTPPDPQSMWDEYIVTFNGIKDDASSSASSASQSASSANASATSALASKNAAYQSETNARTSAHQAETTRTQALAQITTAKNEALQELTNAKEGHLASITEAKSDALTAISTKQNSAVNAVEETKTAAMASVEAKADAEITRINGVFENKPYELVDADTIRLYY